MRCRHTLGAQALQSPLTCQPTPSLTSQPAILYRIVSRAPGGCARGLPILRRVLRGTHWASLSLLDPHDPPCAMVLFIIGHATYLMLQPHMPHAAVVFSPLLYSPFAGRQCLSPRCHCPLCHGLRCDGPLCHYPLCHCPLCYDPLCPLSSVPSSSVPLSFML